MFGPRWKVFRILGIPVYIDATWLIVLGLLAVSVAVGFPSLLSEYFPTTLHGRPLYEYWLLGLATAVGAFVSILLHELGHALVARSQGVPVRDINLFLLGDVADLGAEPRAPWIEFAMAAAGSVVSLALAVLLWLLASAGFSAGWPQPVVVIFAYLGVINIVVLAFNLLPAFPLDGGRVLHSILWSVTGDLRWSTYAASLLGQAFSWVFIGVAIWLFFIGRWIDGIWTFLIGVFLSRAAQTGYDRMLVQQALAGETVQRFMNPRPIVVPPSLDLERWIHEYVHRYHHHAFPVVSEGRLEGVVTTQSISLLPRDQWSAHTIGEVMQQDIDPITVSPQTDALAAMEKMQQSDSSRLLVIDQDRLVGILTLKDLLDFMRTRLLAPQGRRSSNPQDRA